MAQPTTSITLTQVLPAGESVYLGMDPTGGDFSDGKAGGSGGWQIVDRPKQTAGTQWMDEAPMQLQCAFILDGGLGPTPASVEPQCALIFSWRKRATGRYQPPVLAIGGPVPTEAKGLYWVLDAVKFDLAKCIRNGSGARTQQCLSLTLLEYRPLTGPALTHQSPAQIAEAALITKGVAVSRRTYTVRSGDNLSNIAARQLGDYTLAAQIAALNGIRDWRSIKAGQKLKLPA